MVSSIFDYILEFFSVAFKKFNYDEISGDEQLGLGERQSPINIVTDSVVPAENMPPLRCMYDPARVNIVNTGSGWAMEMDFTADRANLSGGPLEGFYKII